MRKTRPMSDGLWRGIIIAEIIVCYFACLAVVSHIRAPEQYRVVTETPLLQTNDFTAFDGKPAEAGGTLPLKNAVPSEAVGYMAKLMLSELEQIQISFQTECPEEFAGGSLSIDLYNFEAGYDNPEQEYQLILQEGHNEAAFHLTPGENPPEEVFLRIFTLDPAGYWLEDVQIYREERLPKVPAGLWIGVGLCFLLLAGTVLMQITKSKE